jgi:hypothetical protein
VLKRRKAKGGKLKASLRRILDMNKKQWQIQTYLPPVI